MAKRKTVQSWFEYPLFDQYLLCPTARYVGGTSKYLCECPSPNECKGWRAAREKYGVKPQRMGGK